MIFQFARKITAFFLNKQIILGLFNNILYLCGQNYKLYIKMQHFIILAEAGEHIGEKKLIEQHLSGSWHGEQWRMEDGTFWEIIVTGVGALNVLRSLREIPRDARLLNIGYAGSSNFAIGSAVCVPEVRLNHPNVTYPEPQLKLIDIPVTYLRHSQNCLKAVCYSNTDFVLQSDYRDCVFDMELAYIASMGFDNLSALKIVSDNLSLHTYREVASGVDEA